MKQFFKNLSPLVLAVLIAVSFTACNKENLVDTENNLSASSIEVIAATPTSDAVYAVGVCTKGMKKDSVDFSTLPASITTYLAANYAGFTVKKSFQVLTSSGTVDGYAVVILFNGNPVAIRFDASGNFLKVLEQRERGDMKDDKGFHHGGRFDCRDGEHRDSISISALPASITSYFKTNYAADTLVHARLGKDGSYFVVSANKVLYATVFTSAGIFVKRDLLPAKPGKHIAITASSLPSAVTIYLAATYPGYVVNKAYSFKNTAGAVQGYLAVVDVNGTKYAILFDANGAFVKAVPVR